MLRLIHMMIMITIVAIDIIMKHLLNIFTQQSVIL